MAKTPNDRRKDRHKSSKMVRIREVFVSPLDALASLRATSTPDEVNRAVREMLEREGLWPPKPG